MKKAVFFFVFIPLFINAQEAPRKTKVRFGLKVSPAFCWMKPEFVKGAGVSSVFTAENNGVRLGINWGPIFEIPLGETFSITTGADINFISGSIRGEAARIESGIESYSWKHSYSARFIDIPFLLKGKTKDYNKFRYFMQFGLSGGFMYKPSTSKVEIEESVTQQTNNITTVANPEDFLNKFRGAMLIGGGAEYNISGTTMVFAGLTFNNGLTNFLSSKGMRSLAADNPSDDFNENKGLEPKSIINFMMLNLGVLF
jgi:hypothetical protein